jgi:hypothetical protein
MSDLLSDPDHRRADMKLIEQAFKQRWEMSPEKKTELMEKLFKIATEDRDATNREIISAARAIIAAEAQNQADEKENKPKEVQPISVGVNIVNNNITVKEDDNWYGNNTSKSITPPNSGSIESG